MAKDAGWTVVSDEYPGSAENPKIPFVCNAMAVPSITFQEMMRVEAWQF
jgi:hypothetical protein